VQETASNPPNTKIDTNKTELKTLLETLLETELELLFITKWKFNRINNLINKFKKNGKELEELFE